MKRMATSWVASLFVMAAVAQDVENPPAEEEWVVPQVAISTFLVKISPAVAADWGLDGGPAAKPESTPLNGDIPKVMTKEQARVLITALRKHKETTILGSISLVVQSGQETFGSNVKEMMLPESFDESEIYVDEETEDEAVKKAKPAKKKERKANPDAPPMKFNLADLVPIFGAPRTDIGFLMVVTPQVAADNKTVSLTLHPKITVDKLVNSLVPMFTTIELRTDVTLRDGQTMILMNGTPGLNGDYFEYKQDAATDRRPYVLFLSVDIVKLPKTPKKK